MDFQTFLGPTYQSQAPFADVERTVNWYTERQQSTGATTRWAMCPTPGVDMISEAVNGPGRAHFFMAGREFAVISTTLYEIDSNGLMTNRGTVSLDANPATISGSGDTGGELFITSGGNGYIYNLGANTLTQIAALNGKAHMGDYLDGYFLTLDRNTSTLYISNLLDGTTWDTGLDFAQRSIAPDPWIAMKVVARYIWLWGEQTSEVWYNTGAASFPFAAHPSGLIPYGCAAAFSVAIAGRDTIWLGTTRIGGLQVLRTAGFTPEVISSYPVQKAMESYTIRDDAIADTYSERGHTFYVLTFPRQGVTWCWDAETQQWHERGTWDSDEGMYTALRERWHAYAFGEHRMLDSVTGALYLMSSEISTDAEGNGIRRLRRAPALVKENQRVYFAAFELDVEVGLGATTGQGENPQVMLRMSRDGGKTWGNERWRSAGKIGEYGKRVRWERCGMARRKVFEVATSDPIPFRLTGAFLTFGQALGGGEQEGRDAAA